MEGIWIAFANDSSLDEEENVYIFFRAESEEDAILKFTKTSFFKDNIIDPSDNTKYFPLSYYNKEDKICVCFDCHKKECECDRRIYNEKGELIDQKKAVSIARFLLSNGYTIKKINIEQV